MRITQVEVILLKKKNAEMSDGTQHVRLSLRTIKASTAAFIRTTKFNSSSMLLMISIDKFCELFSLHFTYFDCMAAILPIGIDSILCYGTCHTRTILIQLFDAWANDLCAEQ